MSCKGTIFTAALALVLCSSPWAGADMVSRWTLDGDLLDSGTGGNHGTFVGTGDVDGNPVFVADRDGNPGTALSLNGTNEFVQLTQSTHLPVSSQGVFSLTLWVKGPPTGSDLRLFSEGSTSSQNPLFNLGTSQGTADAKLNFFYRNDANQTTVNHRKSGSDLFDDSWHHLAWVDDGGQVKVYIDGLLDSTNFSYNRGTLTANTSTLGAILRAAPSHWWGGAIDDARLFDHALTGEEVQAAASSESCPEDGDTSCTGFTIDGPGMPGDPQVGIYTITVNGADTSGDAVLYYDLTVEEAEAGLIHEQGFGTENSIVLNLAPGTYTLTAIVDDNPVCDDPWGICSQELVVAPAPQLVSHWTLDGTTDDATGNANHGAFVGGEDVAPTYVAGFDGTAAGAIQFDGVDDYIDVAPNSNLPIYLFPAYTVALWVKGPTQGDKRVYHEGSSVDNNPLVNIGTQQNGAAGGVDMYIRPSNGGGSTGHVYSDREAFDDAWHHIAWVDDGGVGTLYIDGVRDGSSFTYTRDRFFIDRVSIGGILRATACCFFTGIIDDVRVYNYALDPTEVSALVPELPECVDDADTHCDDLSIVGPDGGGPGIYTATATATDDSADPILYTFFLLDGEGTILGQVGPAAESSVELNLFPGSYQVSVVVDDFIRCKDEAGDASITLPLEVSEEPEVLISEWAFNGSLADPVSGNDGVFVGEDAPPFGEGFDCEELGAITFDGVDDYIRVAHTADLPVNDKAAFTISMWVKGLPQADKRLFSGSSSTNRNVLWNLGTANDSTPAFDVFLRDDAGTTIFDHAKSTTPVFDGEWHHIAWVDDQGQAVLYVDGVPDATDFSYTRSTSFTVDTTTLGGILRETATGDPDPCCYFTGSMDDVRLHNFALTEDDVAVLYGDGPSHCCPEEGDTRIVEDLLVVGPAESTPGLYTVTATAEDDTGDAILYSFVASNGVDAPMEVGPQTENSTTFDLGAAEWEITVTVDDDPLCPDEAVEATRSRNITVLACPESGDTRVTDLAVDGPAENAPGIYLVTATAEDDSGDEILYSFVASNGVDAPMEVGPQTENSTTFDLGTAEWEITVTVDDDADCDDATEDNSQSTTVVVAEPGVGPFARGDANADGAVDLSDGIAIFNWLFLGGGAPLCKAAANTDRDGETINITDGIFALNFLFLGGPAPPAPFGECGNSSDLTDVSLGCESFPPCEEP